MKDSEAYRVVSDQRTDKILVEAKKLDVPIWAPKNPGLRANYQVSNNPHIPYDLRRSEYNSKLIDNLVDCLGKLSIYLQTLVDQRATLGEIKRDFRPTVDIYNCNFTAVVNLGIEIGNLRYVSDELNSDKGTISYTNDASESVENTEGLYLKFYEELKLTPGE
jgi:hypothetical protein